MNNTTTDDALGNDNTNRPDRAHGDAHGDPPAPSRDAFATLVMAECRKRRDNLDLIYDRDQFEIRDGAKGFRMSLSNAYSDYRCAEDGRRQQVLDEYTDVLSVTPKIPASFQEAEGRIYPVIHNRWANDIACMKESQSGRPSAGLLSRRLTDNLTYHVVYYLPTAVIYLQPDKLKDWGVSEDAAFAAAIGNMRKRMADRLLRGPTVPLDDFAAEHGLTASQVLDTMRPFAGQSPQPVQSPDLTHSFIGKLSLEDLGFGHIEGYPGLFAAAEEDWFCPSRILVEDWIRVLPVKGDPVAMISHGGLLLVTGTEDRKSLIGMAELTKGLRGRGHAVSAIPIRLAPHGWETYQPARSHPAHRPFKDLRSEEMTALYSQQQQILQRLPGVDGFVPSCVLAAEADASIGTLTTWAKDAEPLLPKSDWVAFVSVDLERQAAVTVVPPVPWDAVQSIAGHRMGPAEFSPPRYRARGFPSDEEIARLLKAAKRGGFPMPKNAERACRPLAR